jgi:hypothetical protein
MASILAAGFAPAVAGSGVLMPVRKIEVPKPLVLTGQSTVGPVFVTSADAINFMHKGEWRTVRISRCGVVSGISIFSDDSVKLVYRNAQPQPPY